MVMMTNSMPSPVIILLQQHRQGLVKLPDSLIPSIITSKTWAQWFLMVSFVNRDLNLTCFACTTVNCFSLMFFLSCRSDMSDSF